MFHFMLQLYVIIVVGTGSCEHCPATGPVHEGFKS